MADDEKGVLVSNLEDKIYVSIVEDSEGDTINHSTQYNTEKDTNNKTSGDALVMDMQLMRLPKKLKLKRASRNVCLTPRLFCGL